MDEPIEGAYSLGRAVVAEARREDVTFIAASIAYHAFVSLLPVLLLATLMASTFGSEDLAALVFDLARGFLPETGREVVVEALANATASVGVSAVGLAALLWGTSKIFRAMDAAFAEIYDTEREVTLLGQLQDAAVVVVGLALAVGALVVLGSLVGVPRGVPFRGSFQALLSVAGLSVAFFPIYYAFPNADVSLSEVVPGVVVAAAGWVALEWLFGVYVSLSSAPDAYGLVGTLVVLVTWLYFGALVLLVGATVNATLAGRGSSRTDRRGKRRFGRAVADAGAFEDHLDELVRAARDGDVPPEAIRQALRRRASGPDWLSDDGDGRETASAGSPETGRGRG